MARGRIIDKSISTSRKVNSVSDRAALLFTWILPHTDDYGRVEGGADDVLYAIAPRRGWTLEEVCDAIEELWNAGLIKTYRVDGKRYIEVVRFDDFQILRNDRKRSAKCPLPTAYDDVWVRMVADGRTLTVNDIPLEVSGDNVSRSRSRSKVEVESEYKTVGGKPPHAPEQEVEKVPIQPKYQTQQFFEGVRALQRKEDVTWLKELLTNIVKASNLTKSVVWSEIVAFTDYWTEYTHTGTKQKWQCQKTFMVERRLKTWFDRAGFKSFATGNGIPQSSKGKAIIGLDEDTDNG